MAKARFYLVDSETIEPAVWMQLLKTGNEWTYITIYYSEKSKPITYSDLTLIGKTDVQLFLKKCFTSPTGLMPQLAFDIGCRLGANRPSDDGNHDEYYIVSNDPSADSVAKACGEHCDFEVKRLS